MKRIEKIEVRKGNNIYFYTGIVSKYDEENILIETIKNETLIFRKEQVEGRQILPEMKGDELNEMSQNNKSK
jgi:hypothetical protein